MSKVDICIDVENIKAIFHGSEIKQGHDYFFVNCIYPLCDLLYDNEHRVKSTMINQEIFIHKITDELTNRISLKELSEDKRVWSFNAKVKHNRYGTMYASNVVLTGVED